MDMPKFSLVKGLNEMKATSELVTRGILRRQVEEEKNKEFERIQRADRRPLQLIEKCEDKQAIIRCIKTESPRQMPAAVKRAKELDLNLVDLLDILSVRSLSVEDQQDFASMCSEVSNTAEAWRWLGNWVGFDPVKLGRILSEASQRSLIQNVVNILATAKNPMQLGAKRLVQMYFD